MKIPRPFSRRAAGFTLVELVISSGLMAIILTSAYLCLNACLASRKIIEPRVEVMQNARVAMSLLSADLRAASVLSADYQFVGMNRTMGEVEADNLDFATHNYAPKQPHEGDYCQVSYFLDKDAKTGRFTLWRRRNPCIGLDPFSGGRREQIATGLLGLRLEYTDGLDWYDTWGDTEAQKQQRFSLTPEPNATGLPEAVRITLTFDSNPGAKKQASVSSTDLEKKEPPFVFQTVARLNLLAVVQRSIVSGVSSGGTTETPGEVQPGPPGGGQ